MYFDFEKVDKWYWISQGICSVLVLFCVVLYALQIRTTKKVEMLKKHGRVFWSTTKYAGVQVGKLHNVLHRLGFLYSILLLARCVDPVGVNGIYSVDVLSAIAYNTTVVLFAIFAFISWLMYTLAHNVIRQKTPSGYETLCYSIVGFTFVFANAVIVVRIWIEDKFWNYGISLFWIALGSLFLLMMNDYAYYKLYTAVRVAYQVRMQKLEKRKSARKLRLQKLGKDSHSDAMTDVERIRIKEEEEEEKGQTRCLSDSETISMRSSSGYIGPEKQNTRISKRNIDHRKAPDVLTESQKDVYKSLGILGKALILFHLIAVPGIYFEVKAGLDSLDEEPLHHPPKEYYSLYDSVFFYVHIVCALITLWYSYVPVGILSLPSKARLPISQSQQINLNRKLRSRSNRSSRHPYRNYHSEDEDSAPSNASSRRSSIVRWSSSPAGARFEKANSSDVLLMRDSSLGVALEVKSYKETEEIV